MTPEIEDDIRNLVRSGFYLPDEVEEIICDDLHELSGAAADEACAHIAASFEALRQEQETWPPTTDCDRLDAVFEALGQRGIIALQNAGYTQKDGYDDACSIYHESDDPTSLIGYCFYHGQDIEGAIKGGGLYLAFGPMDPEGELTEGVMIGRIIVAELARQGFTAVWDGTFGARIHVPKLDWKKRID